MQEDRFLRKWELSNHYIRSYEEFSMDIKKKKIGNKTWSIRVTYGLKLENKNSDENSIFVTKCQNVLFSLNDI